MESLRMRPSRPAAARKPASTVSNTARIASRIAYVTRGLLPRSSCNDLEATSQMAIARGERVDMRAPDTDRDLKDPQQGEQGRACVEHPEREARRAGRHALAQRRRVVCAH